MSVFRPTPVRSPLGFVAAVIVLAVGAASAASAARRRTHRATTAPLDPPGAPARRARRSALAVYLVGEYPHRDGAGRHRHLDVCGGSLSLVLHLVRARDLRDRSGDHARQRLDGSRERWPIRRTRPVPRPPPRASVWAGNLPPGFVAADRLPAHDGGVYGNIRPVDPDPCPARPRRLRLPLRDGHVCTR